MLALPFLPSVHVQRVRAFRSTPSVLDGFVCLRPPHPCSTIVSVPIFNRRHEKNCDVRRHVRTFANLLRKCCDATWRSCESIPWISDGVFFYMIREMMRSVSGAHHAHAHTLRVILGGNNANSRTCDRMLEGSSRRKRKPHDGRWSAGVGEFWS